MEPCPNCGSDRVYYQFRGGCYFWTATEYWIECYDCAHEGPSVEDDKEALEEWNEWSWFCRRFVNTGRLGYGRHSCS